jgi:ABC-2 type transport system ATP-binding protein
VLLSTHILQEVEAMCDRVLVMIDGRLVADRTLDELLGSDELLLQLSDGAAPDGLTALPGVVQVAPAPALDKPGVSAFLVRYEGEPPVAAVMAFAMDNGWPVRGLAPHSHTLESVVARLTADHVALREVSSGGAA